MIDLFQIFPIIAAFQAPTQATVVPPTEDLPGRAGMAPPQAPFTGEAAAHFHELMYRGALGAEERNDEAGKASTLLGIPMSEPKRHAFTEARIHGQPWSRALYLAGLTRRVYAPQAELERQAKAWFMAPPRSPGWYPFAFQISLGGEPIVIDFRGYNWLTPEWLNSEAIRKFLYGIGLSTSDANEAAAVAVSYSNEAESRGKPVSPFRQAESALSSASTRLHHMLVQPLLTAPAWAKPSAGPVLFDYQLFSPAVFGFFGPLADLAGGGLFP